MTAHFSGRVFLKSRPIPKATETMEKGIKWEGERAGEEMKYKFRRLELESQTIKAELAFLELQGKLEDSREQHRVQSQHLRLTRLTAQIREAQDEVDIEARQNGGPQGQRQESPRIDVSMDTAGDTAGSRQEGDPTTPMRTKGTQEIKVKGAKGVPTG